MYSCSAGWASRRLILKKSNKLDKKKQQPTQFMKKRIISKT